jgi:hypothetical protein
MNPSTPLSPTLRVVVELTFKRDCESCRIIARDHAIAAISDHSVTAIRLVPGSKHAHAVEADSEASEHLGTGGGAASGHSDGTNMLFELPRSDTNGFDPEGRD